MITVVTGFYQIKSKHSIDLYKQWILNFCKIPCNLVVFTDNQSEDFIRLARKDHSNTVIIVRNFYSYEMTDERMMQFWKNMHEIDREKNIHSPELYAVWALKQEFVNLAIDMNPFSSNWFVWCDIGIHRDIKLHSYYENFPNNVPLICKPNYMTFLEISPQIDDKYVECWKNSELICSAPEVSVGGGCIVGNMFSWKCMKTEYIKMLKNFQHFNMFAGKEQTVYFAMLITNKIKFELIHSMPFGKNGCKWMSFPAILSGSIAPKKDLRFTYG